MHKIPKRFEMTSGDIAAMGNLARPMIGLFLMLVTVTAVSGFGFFHFTNLQRRAVRVPVRNAADFDNGDSQDSAE